ncbi:NAD(P)H-quinone oxidoreductase subunit L, chloroplastic [Diospyros lotus]|uniref:NAD(P)H-quinone oxidoreductase subunit L, chloroplastic n=1 Tax=Diospyros lotus TaxID=55363 RepID=UPI00225252CD|nr:NAD(P)H-quinone oxidoreductase subunit L, chloroplastic [Diospyros lotus]
MSCSLSFQFPKGLPSLHQSHRGIPSLTAQNQKNQQKQIHNSIPNKAPAAIAGKLARYFNPKNSCLAVQVGALLSTIVEPAYGVTGVNNEEDFTWVLIQLGISAFLYFLVMPPIIMNWLRIRWYRRNLLEMYLQFMFVFMFFPGVLLWAPFLNFRKFPRDPSMKYPWSTPQDPNSVPNAFLKYPWATPEDYE